MLRALCFLMVLAGCAVGNPPTGPENALLTIAAEKRACTPRPDSWGVEDCGLYVVLDDRTIARLSEVHNGIPYIEPGCDQEYERYALWLGRMATQGRHVTAYIGPYDSDYDLTFVRYVGQEPEEDESI